MGQELQMELAGVGAGEAEREFLRRERASRDTIDVKRAYLDVAGDLVAGILLSQIVFWFLPDRAGDMKTTIERRGRRWLAKKRTDWWEECRVSEKQYDRAIKLLEKRGLVMVQLFRWRGAPTPHIALCFDRLMAMMEECVMGTERPRVEAKAAPSPAVEKPVQERLAAVSILPKGQNEILPKGQNPILPKGQNEILPKGENHSTQRLPRDYAETTEPPTPCEQPVAQGTDGAQARLLRDAAAPLDLLIALQVDRVMQACAFTNRRLRQPIAAQMARALADWRDTVGADPAAVAELMIANYAQYLRDAELMRFRWGPRKFFDEGHWRKPASWPYDPKLGRPKRVAKPTARVEPQWPNPPAGADVAAAKAAWEELRGRLQCVVNPQSFATWIKPLRAGWMLGAELSLLLPDEHFLFVRDKFGGDVSGCLPSGVRCVRWVLPVQDVG